MRRQEYAAVEATGALNARATRQDRHRGAALRQNDGLREHRASTCASGRDQARLTGVSATPTLTTRRLLLVPLAMADAPDLQRLFPRWEVVRFLAAVVPWPYPADGAERYLREIALPAVARGEAWHWSIRLQAAPDELIGAISLMTKEDDNRGFWLAPEHQGVGYMGEACEAVTDFWFDTLGQPTLRVPKAVANTPSRRISERSGMRVVWTGERDYVSGRGPAELWEITAEEWRARDRP